jgi:histone H3/H4
LPPTFSDKDNKALTILVEDCLLYGFTERESMEYINKRFGKQISLSVYYTRKRNIEAGKQADQWLTYFTKAGFLIHHKQLLDSMNLIQQDNFKRLVRELDKPYEEQNEIKILTIKREIRENVKTLAELGTSTPIVSQVKKKIQELTESVSVTAE